MHTSVCAPCEAESSVSPFAKAWRLEKGEMHVKISLLLDQKDVPRGSCSEAIVTLVFVKRLLCERKLNGEGLWCVEMPFPRGREKAFRKKRFFMGIPAKRCRCVWWNDWAASSEQKRGTPFSPAPCVGIAWLCTPGCSARAKVGTQKGYRKETFVELLLTKEQLFLSAQESS